MSARESRDERPGPGRRQSLAASDRRPLGTPRPTQPFADRDRAGRTDPGHFERKYRADGDPWGYETKPYEREKYLRTLAAIGPGPFDRALELGCSIGVFTELLARRCHDLLALDAAPTALTRARTRLSHAPHVRFELRDLPWELPQGPFDLIVASELLYYWDAPLLGAALPRLESMLAPGGRFVAVHWRGDVGDGPLDGDKVHVLLRERTTLRHRVNDDTAAYRLDCWELR
ncbi:trans-aconitate 2-methyltransferase [Conexibacter sp. CPCC 206217]|uniref:class I SAM-dependent methyltransferase n=1 Tax=Conexibacter sp. CPCC 206217 TaxID=3064574 RepID=UPI002724BD8E|nr:SAM-dependent methyltransferase [Conexibacter sp. CPCC 206217]MDO8209877.1 SAM-dependent methyltransferase [Conexibacter sp. CPCC 206217]